MQVTPLPRAVAAVLEHGEQPIEWFVGVDGPRPGVEAFAGLVFVALLLPFGNYWVAGIAAVAFFIVVVMARRHLTVVRTDRGLLLIHGRWRRTPPADAAVERLALGAKVELRDDGDPSVAVGGRRLWVYPLDRYVAFAMARESKSK